MQEYVVVYGAPRGPIQTQVYHRKSSPPQIFRYIPVRPAPWYSTEDTIGQCRRRLTRSRTSWYAAIPPPLSRPHPVRPARRSLHSIGHYCC